MIEVFKTNVNNKKQANALIRLLSAGIPCAEISFDLEDCDKVLKIKSDAFCILSIIKILAQKGFECDVLE